LHVDGGVDFANAIVGCKIRAGQSLTRDGRSLVCSNGQIWSRFSPLWATPSSSNAYHFIGAGVALEGSVAGVPL